MERFFSLVKEANKAFDTADHLAYVTYPVVNDTKLIALVAENLNNSLSKCMEAFLYYDKLYKKIQFLPEDFQARFEIFKGRSQHYNISRENVNIILELREFIDERKKSQIELVKRDRYILYSNLRVKTISLDMIKRYISKAKDIVFRLNSLSKEAENRFKNVNT